MPSYFIVPNDPQKFFFSGLNELNIVLKQVEDHIKSEAENQGIHLIRLNCYYNTLKNTGFIDYETKYPTDYLEVRNLEVGLGLYIHELQFVS